MQWILNKSIFYLEQNEVPFSPGIDIIRPNDVHPAMVTMDSR